MRSNGPPPKPPDSGRPRAVSELDAIQLALSRRIPIWDIRPYIERVSDPGFIPGSRCAPMDPASALIIPWGALLQQHESIALVCLSGRRSEAVVAALQTAGIRGVVHLKEGVLGWQGEGYPLCASRPVEPNDHRGVVALRQLPRAVLSYFVADSVQSPYADASVDAKLIIDEAFSRPGALSSYGTALEVLDLLAENARRLGHPIDHIASNLDGLRATVRRLAAIAPETRAGPRDNHSRLA